MNGNQLINLREMLEQVDRSAQGARGSPLVLQTVGGTTSVTIPLHVTLSLGAPQVAPAGPSRSVPAPAEGVFRRRQPSTTMADQLDRFSALSLTKTSFDWQTALALALASSLSYESRATVESTATNLWGLATCKFIEADDTQCFIASSADAVLVAFRGTESLGDWLGNLNMISTTRDYGAVHRGFLGAFQVVDEQLRTALVGLPNRPVLISGHSLGGALATIAAAEWQADFPIAWVYTYGQPAVGKGGFPAFIARHYAGKFVRFVNDDDIVPRVPPTYRHVGRLFHFDEDGDLQGQAESAVREAVGGAFPPLAESPAEPPMLTETEFDRLRAQLLAERARVRAGGIESLEAPMLEGLLPSISDHSLEEYIAKIAAKL